ncbi:MAG: hypothetical protein NVS2B9_18370 [Myxococcales bacterium]
MSSPLTPCAAHPSARAAWLCAPCGKALCEDCAAPLAAGRGILPACAVCGTLATPLLIPRAQARPFERAVRAAAGEALRPAALAVIVVLTCATGFFASFEGTAWTCAQLLFWAWTLTCCRRAAFGYPPFGVPTYADLAATGSSVLPRLAASVGFLGLGAAVLVDWGHRAVPSLPAALALGAATVWLLPPALVGAVLAGPGAHWIPPWSVPGFAARLPARLGPLRLAAGGFALAAIGSSTVEPYAVLAGDLRLGTHILQTTSLRFAGAVALSMLASLAGRLAFTHADELGHGDPDSHTVPVAPDAVPRGRRRTRG